ncbi:MAG: M36 family metallopeptidase [Saprospiraceae bacterium]|nr:M36 family metallopeptidase [Saprospiraceae bacterium]
MKSQNTSAEKLAGLQLVNANRTEIGLLPDDMNFAVSSSYIDKSAGGIRFVYLQETYKNIPVYNQFQSLAFKDGLLMGNSGSLHHYFVKVKGLDPTPGLTPENAIQAALTDRKLISSQSPVLISKNDDAYTYEYNDLGISYENITVQLMWVPVDDGRNLKLGWQVYLIPINSSDYWMVRIDAQNGKTLGVTNLTVYCNWDTPVKNEDISLNKVDHIHNDAEHMFNPIDECTQSKSTEETSSPLIVNGASYLVIKYPTEAPSFGAESIHIDPWNLGPSGNATTHKWHFDGTTNYTISRGNNVLAKEDRDGNNNTVGLPATSTTTPDPLTFQFVPDYNVEPINATFQQFAITNLFYWNNLMHDMSYNYGFDEAAANFQQDNLGRGGLGNDYVNADAQDGLGTNNANFSTPADGSKGRMQMYLWTAPTPDRDGDLDNGIICHEYGHGINHRLTGGPGSGAGCLSNAERGDEGWSDYFALMMNTNWATATINDGFNIPRGIGTYALNQPTTGAGIRNYKYCNDMAVNPLTYANMGVPPINGGVHNIGEIWCATLWDMTWDIIQIAGINPNLFEASGAGGNSIAMKLVIMGEKLQKCNPGFLDARDAILQADQILYNGLYHCTIINAFARRGMGFNAIQGSSDSATDQTAGFSVEESSLNLTQSVSSQIQLGTVTYTNTVKAYCAALTNYTLRDTLPANVTYVSGGTYDVATRVVSFPVTLAIGATGTYSFTVNINAGSYFPTTVLLNETVPGITLPAIWTATSNNATKWIATAAQSHSAPNSFFGINQAVTSDMMLAMNGNVTFPTTAPFITFWHNYNTEAGWDGGVVEISTNNGGVWTDLGPSMTSNKYNATLGSGSNLAGRSAFTGTSGGWLQTSIRPKNFTNSNARIRFRCASDSNTKTVGWYVDDVVIRSMSVVDIRSSLFNGSGQRVAVSDTFTKIVFPVITAGAATGNIGACLGTPSQSPNIKTFTASGNSLLSDITVTAPTNFEVSLNANSGYATSLTLIQTDNTVLNTLVYVRSSSTAPIGNISGDVILTSSAAIPVNVPVNGVILEMPDASATPQNQTICSVIPIQNIVLTGNTVGTIFNWTRNNLVNAIGIPDSGSGNISGVLTNTTETVQTVLFTIIPNYNGCNGLPIYADVTLYPFVTKADGNYNEENTWLGGCIPPNPLPPGARVNINHTVTKQ